MRFAPPQWRVETQKGYGAPRYRNRWYPSLLGGVWVCQCNNHSFSDSNIATGDVCPSCSASVILINTGMGQVHPPGCNCINCNINYAAKVQGGYKVPPWKRSSSSQTAVRIWWDSQVQAYRLQAPYEPALVETLKTAIAAPQRSYDPASKIWTFTEGYLDPVTKLVEKLFAGAKPQVITRAQVEAAQAPPASSTSNAMRQSNSAIAPLMNEFFNLVPYESMRKAYLTAAQQLHPDRSGGDMDKMTRLNSIWQALEKDFYAKKA